MLETSSCSPLQFTHSKSLHCKRQTNKNGRCETPLLHQHLGSSFAHERRQAWFSAKKTWFFQPAVAWYFNQTRPACCPADTSMDWWSSRMSFQPMFPKEHHNSRHFCVMQNMQKPEQNLATSRLYFPVYKHVPPNGVHLPRNFSGVKTGPKMWRKKSHGEFHSLPFTGTAEQTKPSCMASSCSCWCRLHPCLPSTKCRILSFQHTERDNLPTIIECLNDIDSIAIRKCHRNSKPKGTPSKLQKRHSRKHRNTIIKKKAV